MRATKTAGEAAFAAMQAGTTYKLAELSRLLEIVEGRREMVGREEEPVRVLELGSGGGGSLCAWRTMWPDAQVVAVDHAPPVQSHGAALVLEDTGDERTLARVERELERSARIGEHLVDFLLVDTDAPEADLERYGALVRPGGLAALAGIMEAHRADVWRRLGRWTHAPELVGAHLELAPVWERVGEIVDAVTTPGVRPDAGGFGVAVRCFEVAE